MKTYLCKEEGRNNGLAVCTGNTPEQAAQEFWRRTHIAERFLPAGKVIVSRSDIGLPSVVVSVPVLSLWKLHACCEKAESLPCVCMYSFSCPDHGETHVGTHE